MKKTISLLIILLIILSLFGCQKANSTKQINKSNTKATSVETSKTIITIEDTSNFEGIVFENLTIEFDNQKHKPEVSNLPSNATVEYTPKFGYSAVGIYDYKAVVTIGSESMTYRAQLTISKSTPIVSAEAEQTFYLTDGYIKPIYTVNTDDVDVVLTVTDFQSEGDYVTEIYTKENENYKESEHISVNVHVLPGRCGISFASQTLILDGESVSLDVTKFKGYEELDSNYSLELSQDTFVTQGIYQVTLNVLEKENIIESHRAIITVDYQDDIDFSKYEDDMFVYFMEGDQLSSNIFMCDYTAYGLEHADAIWYSYEEYTDEDYESDLEEIEDLREELNIYKDKKLSYNQINTYKVIDTNITYYEDLLKEKNNVLMKQTYVDQYGGYCADFPTDMEAYTIRRLEDVVDIISYVDSTYDSYMSYYEYILDREEAGYGLSEFTLTKFCEFLDGITEKGNEYYLIKVMEDKITNAKDLLSLSDENVDKYVSDLDKAFKEKFIPVHKELSDKIKAYVELEKSDGGYLVDFTEGYLATYEGGKELYESILRYKLGLSDTTMKEYISQLDINLSKYLRLWLGVELTSKEEKIADGNSSIIKSTSPSDQIEFLKKFADTIVYSLESEPEIDVIYMDETATENTTTVAYYMKSALDSKDKEYIHLNGALLQKNKVETMMTLAHEGYPGHLYDYCLTKESDDLSNIVRVMTNTGFGEGWAKYVESALGAYIAEYKNSEEWANAMEYNKYYDLFAYLLYARMDVGIGYEGWTVSDCEAYLKQKGLNTSIAEEIYQTLIEIPADYAPYGYGFMLFYNWHNDAKEALGEYYDEKKFNQALLENGWIGLEDAKEYIDTFISNQKFLYGITD